MPSHRALVDFGRNHCTIDESAQPRDNNASSAKIINPQACLLFITNRRIVKASWKWKAFRIIHHTIFSWSFYIY